MIFRGQKSIINFAILVSFFALVFAFVYCSPWIFLGQNSHVRIHDSLDSLFAWYVILAREGAWFAPNASKSIPVLAEGLPRVSFPSELTPISFLFAHLEPFTAYVTHQFVIRFLAFSGMATLILILYGQSLPWRLTIAFAGAAVFAAMPFWGWFGGAAAAPWVAIAIVWLLNGQRTLSSNLILTAYASISGIVMTGFVVLGVVWLLFLQDFVRRRQAGALLLAAIVVTMAYLIVDYRLFLFMIDPFFVPHRVEFVFGHTDLHQAWAAFLGNLTGAAAAVPSAQAPVLFTIGTLLLAWSIFWLLRGRIVRSPHFAGAPAPMLFALQPPAHIAPTIDLSIRILWFAIASILATALLTAGWEWSGVNHLRENFELLKMFNFSRASYFNPFFWSLVFVACCAILASLLPRRIAVFSVLLLLLAQMGSAFRGHEHFVEKRATGITFAGFFSEQLFQRIVSDLGINPSSTMVASVGLHPSIAQVNGFHTFDGYLNFYPIDDKRLFREVVFKEFSRDPKLLSYLDDWGNRLYLFSAEVMCPRMGSVCLADGGRSIEDLHVDLDALRTHGVELLFSAIPIAKANGEAIQPIGVYEDEVSAWRIHVYRL
jgi:hypothetical protein